MFLIFLASTLSYIFTYYLYVENKELSEKLLQSQLVIKECDQLAKEIHLKVLDLEEINYKLERERQLRINEDLENNVEANESTGTHEDARQDSDA